MQTELAAQALEVRPQHGVIGVGTSGLEDDPHEERPRRGVLVLLRLAHVEPALKDARRDRGDDPRPVPAREREDGLVMLGGIAHWSSTVAARPRHSPSGVSPRFRWP